VYKAENGKSARRRGLGHGWLGAGCRNLFHERDIRAGSATYASRTVHLPEDEMKKSFPKTPM